MKTITLAKGLIHSVIGAVCFSCLAQQPATPAAKPLESAQSSQTSGKAAAKAPYDLLIENGALAMNQRGKVGANLENVVEHLRETHPEGNFVLAPGLGQINVADLKLRSANVEQQLEAIRIASSSKFSWERTDNHQSPQAIDPSTGQPSASAKEGARPMFTLSPLSGEKTAALKVEAFNIRPYLEAPPEDSAVKDKSALVDMRMSMLEKLIVETVSDYATMVRESSPSNQERLQPPRIRFHPGANTVVIIGETQAVEIAAKLIAALAGSERASIPPTARPESKDKRSF